MFIWQEAIRTFQDANLRMRVQVEVQALVCEWAAMGKRVVDQWFMRSAESGARQGPGRQRRQEPGIGRAELKKL